MHLESSIKFLAANAHRTREPAWPVPSEPQLHAAMPRLSQASTLWLGRSVSSIPSALLPNLSTPAKVMTLTEYQIRGGDFPVSTASFFRQLATAVSACQSQRVQTSAQKSCLALSCASQGILSPLSVSRKGGERTGDW